MVFRHIHIFLALILAAALCGCGQKAGVIFPSLEQPITWPEGEEPARIGYVGQLVSSADLKPGQSSITSIGHAIFGEPSAHTMLTPFAVCTDNAGRVFVADSNAQLVHVFNTATRRYEQWKPKENQPQFAQPVGIAWDPAGRLLVSDSAAACIFVFNSDGRYQGQVGEGLLQRPCGIAIDGGSSQILIADSKAHQLVVLSPNGKEISRVGQRGIAPGQFNFPIDVAMDHQRRVYVVDSLNFRVQQFDSNLQPTRIIGKGGDTPGSFAQPKCVDVDSEDHVYVVDNRFEAVQIFDAEGQLLLNFGREGHGPGEFWLPTGIFIDGQNRIWIADSYNRRIQVFEYLGTRASARSLEGNQQ